MTWADRISFVLTENLDVKRVAPLDVLRKATKPSPRTTTRSSTPT